MSRNCFIPIASGGGIRSIEDAAKLFSIGTDKIILNHCLTFNHLVVEEIADKYGKQAIIGSIDYKLEKDKYYCRVVDGDRKATLTDMSESQDKLAIAKVGELLLTSIDRDGTGNGMDMNILKLFKDVESPIILSGGAGTSEHLTEALNHPQVDAVSTGNLLNFIGDSLMHARESIKDKGIELAEW
jgi:cyclase